MEDNNGLDLSYETKYEEKGNLSYLEVDFVTLTECNGNLRKLQSEYNGNDAIRMCHNLRRKSKGKMSNKALVDTPVAFSSLAKELSEFLEKSCVFFENAGVTFEETDVKVADTLRS